MPEALKDNVTKFVIFENLKQACSRLWNIFANPTGSNTWIVEVALALDDVNGIRLTYLLHLKSPTH